MRRSSHEGRSRRAVLSACGAGMAALAGCADLDVDIGRGDEPEYDADRLAALGEEAVPTPPESFPVSVPDAMVERHRERARELLGRVPEDPAIPNGVVVERLRHDREEVLEDLGIAGDDPSDDHHRRREAADLADEPLDRLGDARRIRGDAAAVEGAYRAATGDVARRAVAGRRERLRSDLHEFERDWTYRGDDPAAAVVLHRGLEELRREGRRAIAPKRAVPDDPTTAVFRVGEIVGQLEDGHAALSDADRLRTRYLDGLAAPRSYRTAITVAEHRLEILSMSRHRELHGHLDPEDPPFDRAIDGTPVERLYREAVTSVRGHREAAEDARDRGDHAEAVVRRGMSLAALRALDAVVTAIEDREVEEPDDAEQVAAARRAAVDALETAWSTTPAVLAVELARPAYYLLRRGTHDLGEGPFGDGEPDASDARRAYASFYRAARYAEAVPATVAALHGALADGAD